MIGPIVLAAEQQAFGRGPFLEERLGQRRPLIGRIGFVADHADRAVVAALSEADRKLRRGLAGAEND